MTQTRDDCVFRSSLDVEVKQRYAKIESSPKMLTSLAPASSQACLSSTRTVESLLDNSALLLARQSLVRCAQQLTLD